MMPAFSRAIWRKRGPEPILMVERDARDHADQRRHHVGGIEPPAEPHLEHHQSQRASRKHSNASTVQTSKNVSAGVPGCSSQGAHAR